MHILRIDTDRKNFQNEDVKSSWEQLGGRGLIANILLDEVDPKCEPLGAQNKLIFAPGLLVGHMLSSCDRISIGGKSPLTGGVKESNAGGTTGLKLAYLGIKAMIIENQPAHPQWTVIVIDPDGVRFESAVDLVGKGVYEAASILIERYGKNVGISVIGLAGERQYRTAGIANIDKDHVPSRMNARGGLGALMGSKFIKAIVFDASNGQKPPIVDNTAFKAAQKEFSQALMAQPQTAIYRDFGTAGVAQLCNSFGALPTRGFSAGQFELVETISGEYLRQTLLERGGKANPTHACMPGCTIQCSNNYAGADGNVIVSPLEYETIGLMGSNLGIGDLDEIARLNWEANDLGLDSIDLGAALGVAAQAGKLEFGNGKQALQLIAEIRSDTPTGRALGHGAAATGKFFGIDRVPVVKNQALSAYDPRAIKGTGVTYATSPQGADHTSGLTIRAKIDHLDPAGQVEVSRKAQINMAGYDTLGACIFAGFGFAAAPEAIKNLLNARYGWNTGTDILQVLGKNTLRAEVEFNRLAGFTNIDDRLPDWLMKEALPPTGAVFDVDPNDMDTIFNDL